MKILIHSNAPWVPSGYGKQTALLIPRLLADGHEVVVSCISGLDSGEVVWSVPSSTYPAEQVRCLPRGQYNFGPDTFPAYIGDEHPDLALTVMDSWMLGPAAEALRSAPLASWVPSDCRPLSAPEKAFLEVSGSHPLAMTRYAQACMYEAGLTDVTHIPHAVDTTVFRPFTAEEKLLARGFFDVDPDAFVVGMVAANNDSIRKAFPEQLEAFRRLRISNAKAHMIVHTNPVADRGLNLLDMCRDLGIGPQDVSFTASLPQVTGRLDDVWMARLYSTFDVLTACSYAEGFCVPILEAQACGVPVITSDFGAMKEVGAASPWLVRTDPFWNPVHKAWWGRPEIASIEAGMKHAANSHRSAAWGLDRVHARGHATAFDADVIFDSCWRPFLAKWEASR